MVSRQGKRRAGILALAAVLGTTAHGQSRPVTAAALASPLAGAVRLGEEIRDLGQALSTAASRAASFGILLGTVVSRMEPGVRDSILAEMEGAPQARKPSAGAPALNASRCARKVPAKKAPRCSRA
jgi:hypothetical protein